MRWDTALECDQPLSPDASAILLALTPIADSAEYSAGTSHDQLPLEGCAQPPEQSGEPFQEELLCAGVVPSGTTLGTICALSLGSSVMGAQSGSGSSQCWDKHSRAADPPEPLLIADEPLAHGCAWVRVRGRRAPSASLVRVFDQAEHGEVRLDKLTSANRRVLLQQPPGVVGAVQRPMRLLIVDDVELNLVVAQRLLEMGGHSVVATCADGRQALDWLCAPSHEVDAVLMVR